MKDRVLVFYANQLYGDYECDPLNPFKVLRDLPEGSYIRFPHCFDGDNIPSWYLSDFTLVLDSDVPKELLVLVLLLT